MWRQQSTYGGIVDEPDPDFAERFKRLDTVSSSGFHTYTSRISCSRSAKRRGEL
jgi:hypothetical protein